MSRIRGVVVLVALAAGLSAQVPPPAYDVTRWTGDHGFLFDFRGYATAVLGPSQDLRLHPAQGQWDKRVWTATLGSTRTARSR